MPLRNKTAIPAQNAVWQGDDAATFRSITLPECALAIWRRRPDRTLSVALAALDHRGIDDVNAFVSLAEMAEELPCRLTNAGYPRTVVAPLANEIGLLFSTFATLSAERSLNVRLEWVETDACRRFHSDQLGMRLLCTLLGCGTQWKYADQPDTAAQELAAGDVAVFKGRLLSPSAPILHRSPPIAAAAQRRLLLVLDAFDPNSNRETGQT